jgi:hypothetical protein
MSELTLEVNKHVDWADYLFSRFVGDRIRLPVTVDEKIQCLCDPVTTNKIKTAVAAWQKQQRVHLNTTYVIERLTKMFGEPRDGCKWTIILIQTRGGMIDWDDEHS